MKKIMTIAAVSLMLATSPLTVADNTKMVIKHRQGVMEAIGGHFGAAFSSMRGMDQFNTNQVFHAESLAALAKISADTFPAGSGDGKTKASADIWEKPEEFKKAMDEFVAKANTFAAASKADDLAAYGEAAKALGKSCKGCHDNFKEK
ncbi:MAG: cytochrome c556 [Oceanicoccus sp.]|jgi:cytochrome c556